MKIDGNNCPIGLDKVHCQNCYFATGSGKCGYQEEVKKNGDRHRNKMRKKEIKRNGKD